jgi:hypothetical protein
MNSIHNYSFLSSFTFSHDENADFFVSNQVKNSIENFMTMKGGTKYVGSFSENHQFSF